MNKKQNPGDVLNKNATVRYKFAEYQTVTQKAKDAGMSFSDFCRQMTLKGYVQAVHTSQDINEIREFKALLIEYRTNFSRLSNLIKVNDPSLNHEIEQLKNSIQSIIEKIKL